MDDKYKRKYDKELQNDLRILEELHYHSHNESRYISEIRTALIEQGVIDENDVEVELKLKEKFKKTSFYKSGLIYANEKKKRSFEQTKSFADLGVKKKNIVVRIMSGGGKETALFKESLVVREGVKRVRKDFKIKNFETHIIRNALAKNDFFDFTSLKKYFPTLTSISEFIENNKYLADFGVTFEIEKYAINIDNLEKFKATLKLLEQIEKEIKANLTEYIGSEDFTPFFIKDHKLSKDKSIKVKKDSERLDGQEEFLENKDWYVFNANYGTIQEKDFVKMIDAQVSELRKKFKNIYLFRNERQLKIYNFSNGQAFEPDYLLFLVNKGDKGITYQLFLEPKGKHLLEHDKWKSEFLEEIKEKFGDKILEFSKSQKYKIIGVPFYNTETENDFKEKLLESIK